MDITTLVNSIINALLSLTATPSNAIAIWKTSSLHSATNVLMFSLSLSDLGVGLICQPLLGVTFSPKVAELYKQEGVLQTGQTITASLAAVSLVTVTAIGLDRYLAVRLHLRYKELVTTKRTVCFVILIWMACILTVSFCIWLDGNRPRHPVAFYTTAAPAVVACFLYLPETLSRLSISPCQNPRSTSLPGHSVISKSHQRSPLQKICEDNLLHFTCVHMLLSSLLLLCMRSVNCHHRPLC